MSRPLEEMSEDLDTAHLRIRSLGEIIRKMLVRVRVLRKDAVPSGPELILAADEWLAYTGPVERDLAVYMILSQFDVPGSWALDETVPQRKTIGYLVRQVVLRFSWFDAILSALRTGHSTAQLISPLGKNMSEAVAALSLAGFLYLEDDVGFLTKAGEDELTRIGIGKKYT